MRIVQYLSSGILFFYSMLSTTTGEALKNAQTGDWSSTQIRNTRYRNALRFRQQQQYLPVGNINAQNVDNSISLKSIPPKY